jgi:hypothetical protein
VRRKEKTQKETLTAGEVVIPEIRRRWSTWGLMRRMRPGRARLIADRGSQGTKAPDVDSSPFADKIYPSSSLTSRLLTLKAKSQCLGVGGQSIRKAGRMYCLRTGEGCSWFWLGGRPLLFSTTSTCGRDTDESLLWIDWIDMACDARLGGGGREMRSMG